MLKKSHFINQSSWSSLFTSVLAPAHPYVRQYIGLYQSKSWATSELRPQMLGKSSRKRNGLLGLGIPFCSSAPKQNILDRPWKRCCKVHTHKHMGICTTNTLQGSNHSEKEFVLWCHQVFQNKRRECLHLSLFCLITQLQATCSLRTQLQTTCCVNLSKCLAISEQYQVENILCKATLVSSASLWKKDQSSCPSCPLSVLDRIGHDSTMSYVFRNSGLLHSMIFIERCCPWQFSEALSEMIFISAA